MAKRNYKPEEIIGFLHDVEIMQGKGKTTGEACRELGISEAGCSVGAGNTEPCR